MGITTFRPLLPAVIAMTSLSVAALAKTPAAGAAAVAPPQTVQQQNEEILKELRAIRQLLEGLRQPQPAVVPQPTQATITNLTGFALGNTDAPLTMIEFTDLQCPFCRRFVLTSFDRLKKDWIDTGKLRYISRDFPLENHAQAIPAARAARCAGDQGKFWDMRLALMRNANILSPDYITRTAAGLQLDMKRFMQCTTSAKHDTAIQADLAEGKRIGVSGTPTFVIGRSTPDGISGPMVVGALPYAQFDARLKELLK